MNKFLLSASLASGFAVISANPAQALDLTVSSGNISGNVNGAIFEAISPNNSAGTGTFDPFLRIQANNNEEGFNTTPPAANQPLDAKQGTKAIKLSDIPTVTINNVLYREILLDWNENNNTNGKFLNLTELQVFLADTANLGNLPSLAALDASVNTSPVLYDLTEIINFEDVNSGSGRADARILLPNSIFANQPAAFEWFTLYSSFSDTDATFEEFSARVSASPVPTPALLPGLLGMGVAALRKRQSASAQ